MLQLDKDFLTSLKNIGDEVFSSLLDISGDFGENFLFFALEKFGQGNLDDIKAETYKASEIQEKLLLNILNLQKNTEYGKNYSFRKIKSSEDFKKVHPLTTYKNYSSILEDIANTGNYKRLVAEPIVLFQNTSDNDGKNKLVPRIPSFTKSLLKTAQAAAGVTELYLKENKKNSDPKEYKALTLANAEELKFTSSGIPIGSAISGGLRQNIKFKSVQKILNLKSASPSAILLISNYQTAYYCHLLFGLIESNLTFISVGLGASNFLATLQLLEEKWPQLIEDVELGQIDSNLDLELPIREQLQSLLSPNPERARLLKTEFEKGFESILSRIWTKLSHVQINTTGEPSIFEDKFKKYIGKIPYFYSIYGISEAFIGINLEPEKSESVYAIPPDSAFFEFIPISEINKNLPLTVSLTSLVPEESYEVIITTIAGLYRYRTGRIVKCLGYYNQSPLIEFEYCKDYLLDIYGEKITEKTIFKAVTEALVILEEKLEIVNFTTEINVNSKAWKYVIYVELSKRPTEIAKLEKCKEKIETFLLASNPYYEKLRKNNRLEKTEFYLLNQGSFKRFREKFSNISTFEGIFKIPRFLEKTEMLNFIKNEIMS